MLFDPQLNLRRLRTRSFPISSRVKPTHSLSYPRVPSVPAKRPMVSVKSEGANTLRTKFNIQENERAGNAPERKELHRDESRAKRDESSDDSGGEEEHIVRIDSPSRLSFRQAP